MIRIRWYRCILRTLAAALVAAAAFAVAQPLPGLELDPMPSVDALRPDLAETIRDATLWLFEEDEDAVSVWVWRVPGDPDPEGLFADNAWAEAPDLIVRDLGEAMRATVDVFGAFFEARDPGWSDRALALAERLAGVEERQTVYTVIADDGGAFYGVQISDRFIDLRALEALDGTWVQVTLLTD